MTSESFKSKSDHIKRQKNVTVVTVATDDATQQMTSQESIKETVM